MTNSIGSVLKAISALSSLLTVSTAAAQTNVPPIPVLILLYTTNCPGLITVVHPLASSWSEGPNHQTVFTNLTLTCMIAQSLTTKSDADGAWLLLRDGTIYEPLPHGGNYAKAQGIHKGSFKDWSMRFPENEIFQVNGEILTAGQFVEKFKAIPSDSSPVVKSAHPPSTKPKKE